MVLLQICYMSDTCINFLAMCVRCKCKDVKVALTWASLQKERNHITLAGRGQSMQSQPSRSRKSGLTTSHGSEVPKWNMNAPTWQHFSEARRGLAWGFVLRVGWSVELDPTLHTTPWILVHQIIEIQLWWGIQPYFKCLFLEAQKLGVGNMSWGGGVRSYSYDIRGRHVLSSGNICIYIDSGGVAFSPSLVCCPLSLPGRTGVADERGRKERWRYKGSR